MRRSLAFLTVILCSTFVWSSARAAEGSDTFNFRFSPIGLIVGSVNVGLDIAVTPDWTVGPQLNYWHLNVSSGYDFTSNFDITTYGVGARANWFHNGVYTDGLYVGPSLKYVNVALKTTNSNGNVSGSTSGLLAGCLVGYGWFWNSFNMMLGIGADIGLGSTNVTVVGSDGTTTSQSASLSGLDGEFSLGWTF